MLILTRSIGESIIIGEEGDIEVKILDVKRCQVRVGINAPKDIPVHRYEIWQKVKAEQEQENKNE